jgi:NitT/TauT family transport system substrate-binding protein
LQKDTDVWTRFLRAILKAEKFTKDHHEETVDIILKYVKLDHDTIRKACYEGYLDQSSDPNKTGVKNFWHTMQSSEFVSSQQDISSFVVTDLYKNAVESLAAENPKDAFWIDLQRVYSERNL